MLRCARLAKQASHFGVAFQLRVACLSAGQNAAQGGREAGGVHVGSNQLGHQFAAAHKVY